ncbi:hypothetical protein COV18_07465 [Candidatus Woesearchaeota archaeon CG10_big_fil_rev_8_21_14_0_10_37_12]|nr:MAG: hypothetical protein COV18_07465 [Candidatus Woesearchaeota archaeon CG10_big_fil_rev_8_21_14_0_10_37_12]
MISKRSKTVLEELGLTNAESKIYLELLRLGESKVGEIIKRLPISASNIHDALDKLVKKGLVTFVVKNNIKHYFAPNPKNLNVLLDKQKKKVQETEKELKALLPRLQSITQLTEKKQDAEVFIGINGLKNSFRKLVEGGKKGQEMTFFYTYSKTDVGITHKFFAKMDIEDIYKNIPMKGICSKEYEPLFKKRKKSKVHAKFTDWPIPSNIDMYNGKTLITAWTEIPIGFLISSKEITVSFERLFWDVWRKI